MITDFQFDEDLHRYVVDNQLQPHVTAILERHGLENYAGVAFDLMERKQILGSAVHRITHLMDADGLDLAFAMSAVSSERHEQLLEHEIELDELMNYSLAWMRFLAESKFECFPGYVERRHVAEVNGMRYGMTIDRAGLLKRLPTILDLKCTASREKAWPLQLAGYRLGLPKPSGVARWESACVWLKPDRTYNLCPDGRTFPDRINQKRDEEVFLAALRLTWWKAEQYGRYY